MNKTPWSGHQLKIIYPQEQTLSGDRLYRMFQDAVNNDECPEMPATFEDALEVAEEYLDITIEGRKGDNSNENSLYQAQYAYACGYYD